jgi:hypothetical protein
LPSSRSSPADHIVAKKPPYSETGMGLANYNCSKSDAALNEKTQRSTWGGSRNRASRTSCSLSLERAVSLFDAAFYAAAIGLPLNRHVTIHWERAGVPDCRAAAATGAFLTLARDLLRKRGGRVAWVWVRENEGRGSSKGSHVHILLHVPTGMTLGRMQRRWLRRITHAPYRTRTIRTARIGGRTGTVASAPAVYYANLAAVLGYVLKGASPEAARALGLEKVKAAGRIIGKRVATSQNIGRAARAQEKPPP